MPDRASELAAPQVIQLHGREVTYVVKRSRRRTIGLTVDESGLSVRAPLRAPLYEVRSVVQQHAHWVLAKLHAWQERRVPPPAWIDGETLPYLGGQLMLRIGTPDLAPDVLFADGKLWVYPSALGVQSMVVTWYREQALPHFRARIEHFATRLPAAPAKVLLSNARSQWGSCNAKGEVRLNWRLLKAPPACIDYVIAHEIAHLKHMNHSAAFWHTVERLYPGYQEASAQLRDNDSLYRAF